MARTIVIQAAWDPVADVWVATPLYLSGLVAVARGTAGMIAGLQANAAAPEPGASP